MSCWNRIIDTAFSPDEEMEAQRKKNLMQDPVVLGAEAGMPDFSPLIQLLHFTDRKTEAQRVRGIIQH